MSGTAIVSMIIVLGVVVGGFAGLLALAIRHEARRGRGSGRQDGASGGSDSPPA